MSPQIEAPASFAIGGDKISDYLLNVDHAEGGPKARFFLSFGFSLVQMNLFAEALFQHASPQHLIRIRTTLWGVRFIFEGPIITPDNRNPFIRSVWQTPTRLPGAIEGTAGLLTAYPP